MDKFISHGNNVNLRQIREAERFSHIEVYKSRSLSVQLLTYIPVLKHAGISACWIWAAVWAVIASLLP